MTHRVKAAADAKADADFFLIARTDAIQVEAVDAVIKRSRACVEASADGIFAEASYDLETYRRFVDAVQVPVLAHLTEFGQTPLFTREGLAMAGVSMMIYPLSAFRAMNKAAEAVFTAIRHDRQPRNVVDTMQTREALYERIGYHDFERSLDKVLAGKK